MARGRPHLAGGCGRLCHGAAQLLLLCAAGGELEGEEEEKGPLSNRVERKKRLHAPDKVRAGQRIFLRDKTAPADVTFLMFDVNGTE